MTCSRTEKSQNIRQSNVDWGQAYIFTIIMKSIFLKRTNILRNSAALINWINFLNVGGSFDFFRGWILSFFSSKTHTFYFFGSYFQKIVIT